MAFDVGKLQAVLELNKTNFDKGVQGAKKGLNSFQGKLGAVGSAVFNVKNAIVGLAGTTGLGLLAKNAITSAAKMEQTRVSFETMVGSAEKAESLISDLTEFANTTPFENFDVTDAAKSLISYGTEAGDVQSVLKRIGDVAAGVNAPIGEMASLFGKMQSSGVIFTEDLNQLADRGIPIFKTLEKQFGKTTLEIRDMASKAEISFDDIDQAFATMTNTGEPFLEMLEINKNGFEEFLPPVQNVLKALGESGDDVDVFFEQLEKGGYKTEDVKSGLDELGFTTADLFKAFNDGENAFGMFADMMVNQSETVNGKLSTIAGKFQNLMVIIGEKLFPIVKPVLDEVIGLIDKITLAVGGEGEGGGMLGAFSGFLPIFEQVKEALTLFFETFKSQFEMVKQWLIDLGLVDWFMELFQGVADILTLLAEFWAMWGDEIISGLQIFAEWILMIFQNAVDLVMGVVTAFLQILTGDWKGALDTLWQTAQDILDRIFGFFESFGEKVGKIWDGINEKIANALDMDQKHSPSINDRLAMIREGIQGTIDSIAVPDFTGAIASSLDMNTGGGFSQSINVQTGDINNGADITSLSRQLAFRTVQQPGIK